MQQLSLQGFKSHIMDQAWAVFEKNPKSNTDAKTTTKPFFPHHLDAWNPFGFDYIIIKFSQKDIKGLQIIILKSILQFFVSLKYFILLLKWGSKPTPRNEKKRRLATGVWVFHVKEWRYTIIRSVFSAFQHGRKFIGYFMDIYWFTDKPPQPVQYHPWYDNFITLYSNKQFWSNTCIYFRPRLHYDATANLP
jgi:hypothetical protein